MQKKILVLLAIAMLSIVVVQAHTIQLGGHIEEFVNGIGFLSEIEFIIKIPCFNTSGLIEYKVFTVSYNVNNGFWPSTLNTLNTPAWGLPVTIIFNNNTSVQIPLTNPLIINYVITDTKEKNKNPDDDIIN